MEVVGVRVEMPSNQPIVLLRETDGQRFLPIWIGAMEATAIAFAQQGVEPPRPLTHDLMAEMVTALGRTLEAVRITDLQDGVFYAVLVFDDGTEVSARPSDALALALRTDSPVFAAAAVLEQAGIEISDDDAESGDQGDNTEQAQAELEKFREFLDQISPEDFQTG